MGRKRQVTAKPTKHDTPNSLYRKIEPITISIGESVPPNQLNTRHKNGQERHIPTSANICHANSLTRSTSVVIRVMICALLENSLSPFSTVCVGCSSAALLSGTVVC